MHPEALPPFRHVSSKPISLDAASSMLHTYLSNSEAHPHLHPDALITPTGVTFSSHGGPMGGVVMHNLRRVAAGLRGEYLEPERTPEPEEGDEEQGVKGKGAKGKKGKRKDSDHAAVEEGWQNMSEYEREQGEIEAGQDDERITLVQEGGEAPAVETGDAGHAGKKRKKGNPKEQADGQLDKEARKKAKKERNQERKRAKANQPTANDD